MDSNFQYKIAFPEPNETFKFLLLPIDLVKKSSLFILDANVLLTPLTVGSESLEVIKSVYETLNDEDRIFIPSQSIREYLANRPNKLAELHDSLSKKLSQSFNYVGKIPLLENISDYRELMKVENELKEKIKEYHTQLKEILKNVSSWGWDDPVSKMYHEVLKDRILSEEGLNFEQITKDLKRRNELGIPPGFADKGKSVNSAGDVVIWHEILNLARTRKQHLIFVSGDEKNDWWHISNKQPLYPRIELVDEYRRASEGKCFYIITLSRLLEMFDADKKVVSEVEQKERILLDEDTILISKPTQSHEKPGLLIPNHEFTKQLQDRIFELGMRIAPNEDFMLTNFEKDYVKCSTSANYNVTKAIYDILISEGYKVIFH